MLEYEIYSSIYCIFYIVLTAVKAVVFPDESEYNPHDSDSREIKENYLHIYI